MSMVTRSSTLYTSELGDKMRLCADSPRSNEDIPVEKSLNFMCSSLN